MPSRRSPSRSARSALAEFGKQEGELLFMKSAPAKRQEIWRKLGIVPRGIDREVVELMHRTHMGVDQDYQNLSAAGVRAAPWPTAGAAP